MCDCARTGNGTANLHRSIRSIIFAFSGASIHDNTVPRNNQPKKRLVLGGTIFGLNNLFT